MFWRRFENRLCFQSCFRPGFSVWLRIHNWLRHFSCVIRVHGSSACERWRPDSQRSVFYIYGWRLLPDRRGVLSLSDDFRVFKEPLLIRCYFALFMSFAFVVFVVEVVEDGNGLSRRLVFGVAAVAAVMAGYRQFFFDRTTFYQDHVLTGTALRTRRFERADIVSFFPGAGAWAGGRKLGIEFLDGRATHVPLPKHWSKQKNFGDLLSYAEHWLEPSETDAA